MFSVDKESKKTLSKDTVDFVLRDVKEYAASSHDLNVYSLQLKLMHLEDLGPATLHEDRKLYLKVLERFQVRKNHPEVGSIILTLLSSSTDALDTRKDRKNPEQEKIIEPWHVISNNLTF